MAALLIRFLSAPFIIAGFVWQFMAGSFYAGKLLSNVWIAGRAVRHIERMRAASNSQR